VLRTHPSRVVKNGDYCLPSERATESEQVSGELEMELLSFGRPLSTKDPGEVPHLWVRLDGEVYVMVLVKKVTCGRWLLVGLDDQGRLSSWLSWLFCLFV